MSNAKVPDTVFLSVVRRNYTLYLVPAFSMVSQLSPSAQTYSQSSYIAHC